MLIRKIKNPKNRITVILGVIYYTLIIYKGKSQRTLHGLPNSPNVIHAYNIKAWCTGKEWVTFLNQCLPNFGILRMNLKICCHLLDTIIWFCLLIVLPFKDAIRKEFHAYMVEHIRDHTYMPKPLLRKWVLAAWEKITDEMINKAFECVGVGTPLGDRQKIYWYRLQSLQKEIQRTPLPSVASNDNHLPIYLPAVHIHE